MNYIKLFGIATLAIGAILYLASGDDHEVIAGNQNYDLGEFVKISVNISTNMKVKVGEDYGLIVKAAEEDLKNIAIYVKGQTLVLDKRRALNHSWRGTRPEIIITLPKIKKFTLNGPSDVEIKNIHGRNFIIIMNGGGKVDFEGGSDELLAEVNGSGSLTSTSYDARDSEVDINGSGSVMMAGKCQTFELEINGSGDFSGKDYQCGEVDVDIIGSGDAEVFVRSSIEVDVMGSGDVDVYGKPTYVKDNSNKNVHVTIH